MSTPLISVVMNCFNGAKYLREAIESVLQQTYENWELVFWDNQSTDESASVLQSYKDRRIRYLRAPLHTRLGAARRLAVEQCRGDFISFLDTDDIYLPENLCRKLEHIEREQAAVVYAGVIYIDENGTERRRRLPRNRSGLLMEALLCQYEADIPTMMIRRSVLQKTGLNFDECIYGSEEFDLLVQLSVKHPFAVAHEYWAKLRHHRGSLTYAVMDKWASDRVLTLSKIEAANPGIASRYPKPFKEAYARARYYRARWCVANGNIPEAVDELRIAIGAGWRYCGLYAVLRISPALWSAVHRFLPSARQF